MATDIWISLIEGAGFCFTALYVAIARRHRPTWVLGVILLVFCAELTFAHALQNLSPDFASRVFWYKMVYLGFTITPTAFFSLALRYGGFNYLFTNRTKLCLIVFPALTNGLIFTNEMHGLMWKPALTHQIVYSPGFLSTTNAGIWYWIFLIYSYLMMGLGFITFAWLIVRSKKMYGWQVSALLLAGFLATLGTTVDLLGFSLLPAFSTTALGFAVGTITAALILSRIRRRDLISVSRTTIINSIDDSIIVVDVDNRIVDLNPAAEKLLGKRASQTIGKPINQSLPELALFWEVKSDDIGEVTLIRENITLTFSIRVSAIKDWRGQFVCKVAVLRDITMRKRAEEDLRRATEGARAIFWRASVTNTNDETVGARGFSWNTHYSNLDTVNEFLPLQLYPSKNFADRFYFSWLEEDRIAMDQTSTQALLCGAEGYSQEFRLRDANGSIHWMYDNARIKKLSETQYEVIGFMTDITEQKATQEVLKESEARLLAFFENEPTGKIIVNSKTRIIQDANNSALEMIGLPKEEVVGKLCHVFLLCPVEVGHCSVCDIRQDVDRSEQVLLKPGGTKVPILKAVVPIKIKGEDYLLESFIDITDRKKAEEKILASIEEKEALLKEIHHRVKNNMQIISSMMNLQASKFTNENLREAFRESQNRIRSMALVHEKLYQSENLAHIRLDEYLQELTIFLMHAYNEPSRNIKLDIEADPVNIDIDTAIPCGLIINELVTNSLKHGFPDSARTGSNIEGMIHIRLALLPENQIILLVTDNGVGFPEGVDFQNNSSLGLQLVTTLTYQLDGEVNFMNHNGAQVELKFTSMSAYKTSVVK